MALFPDCTFRVFVPEVVPGQRLEGILELEVPEDIPRADHVHLFFQSRVWAGYGSGKHRSVHRRDLFLSPLILELPHDRPLAAGAHRFPFAIDVPAWLPPNYVGADCAIEHVIEARLDVDWAVDPKTRVTPRIATAPREGVQSPTTIRSPAGFHDAIVLEVALGSTIRADEPLSGTIALRGGHHARFDAVVVSYQGIATIAMARGDRRYGGAMAIRIPAERLRSGDGVPFMFPPDAVGGIPPTFRSGFIDHDVALRVSVDIPWASDPVFDVPLHVLPRGSVIHTVESPLTVGGERLRQIAVGMANATGLRPGRAPTLVEGVVGPAYLHVDDGPREGRLGIDVAIAFPDVDLGITFRPLGLLEGFRESPLLPAPLNQRYLLRVVPEGPPIPESALGAFFQAVLGGLQAASDVQLADHHLRLHFPLANDGGEQMVELARAAQHRARAIVDAISALPSPNVLSLAFWQAMAAEQSGFLVPSGPSIFGLVTSARILGGEERSLGFAVRTIWENGTPSTRVDVDLGNASLTKDVLLELTRAPLPSVRAVFPTIAIVAPNRLVLAQPTFAADPRTLLPAVEALLHAILEIRGERSAIQPYR